MLLSIVKPIFKFSNYKFKYLNTIFFSKRSYSVSAYKYPVTMQIDTPEFKSIFTNDLQTLLQIFESYNYEIRIAGGAVRDILLGKNPKDIDFATTATPEEMKNMFKREGVRMINTKGEKHGTITARINSENFEVTTLRIDVSTDGRHAKVQFTTDWELDANRRDLTINSMFLDKNGIVYDYFGGYEDLKKRRVAFVGEPSQRIQEDYLRILRYFRFFGRIAEEPDNHDDQTINAIKNNISGLEKISGERIWLELSKILSGNYVSSIIQRLVSVGAGPYIAFPSNPNLGEMKSIWEKSKNLNMKPICLIVSLMSNDEEMLSFHKRCKLSAHERDLGLFLINYRNIEVSDNPLKSYQALLLKSDRNIKETRSFILELFKYNSDLNLLHEFQLWEPPRFPVDGAILIKHGVPPGKMLGHVLKGLKNIWIERNFIMNEKDCLDIIPEIINEVKAGKNRGSSPIEKHK